MQLWEIAIAFRNCTGESRKTYAQHIRESFPRRQFDQPLEIRDAYNYILADVERLVDKAIINALAADSLFCRNQPSWAYVTAYYANFFLFQSLSRLHLDFHAYVDSYIHCRASNYSLQKLTVASRNRSDNHQREYQAAKRIFGEMRQIGSIDRLWSIGSSAFRHGDEVELRNSINYEIRPDHYLELFAEESDQTSIRRAREVDPFERTTDLPSRYAYPIESLKYAVARLRIVTYTLNFVANRRPEYRSYYVRNMRRRADRIRSEYRDGSSWLTERLLQILAFESIPDEEAIL